jgi:flagellar biosynthesis protein FliQ
MNADVTLFWMRESVQLAVLVAAPLLGIALAVGLTVSLFQAITSIQEMTLSAIPKLLAVAIVLVLLAPWMLQMLTDFTTQTLSFIPEVSR